MPQQAASSSSSSAPAASNTEQTNIEKLLKLIDFIGALPEKYAKEKKFTNFNDCLKDCSNNRSQDILFLRIVNDCVINMEIDLNKQLKILEGALLYVFLKIDHSYKFVPAGGASNGWGSSFFKFFAVQDGSYLYKEIGKHLEVLQEDTTKPADEEKIKLYITGSLIEIYQILMNTESELCKVLTPSTDLKNISSHVDNSISSFTVRNAIHQLTNKYFPEGVKLPKDPEADFQTVGNMGRI